MSDLQRLSGLVEESELEMLTAGQDVSGGHVTVPITIAIAASVWANACPTSACTRACRPVR